MNKQVFFIEFRDYPEVHKLLPYVDGVVYPSGDGDNDGGAFPSKFGNLEHCLGEFFLIRSNADNEIIVKTDFCGFYPLFWKEASYEGKKGVLLSNCFHSISVYSESALDPSKLVPNISSKNQMFMQDYSNCTSLDDVRRLGWNEKIVISCTGAAVIKDNEVVSDGYRELIAKGVKQAQNALDTLSKKKTLNLYFSGGKDSRAILALLMQIGIRPKCTTQDPDNYKGKAKENVEKDFRIVTSLAGRYNLEWFENPRKNAFKISFSQSLELHSFYRNGYYLYSPSQYIVYDNIWGDEVQLRGGGGGLYKSTWGEYIKNSYINKKLKGKKETITSDGVKVYEELVSRNGVPEEMHVEAKNKFLSSIDEISIDESCSNIYKTLDLHYIGYRNRSHFGHIRNSEAHSKMVFHPLINEHFYNASLMLSPEEKEKGKLIFDIIEYCAPELNEFPYDDGYHELLPRARDRKTLPQKSWVVELYKKNKKVNDEGLKGVFKGKAFDAKSEEMKFIDESIYEIVEMIDKDLGLKKDEFLTYISSLKEDKKFRGKLCAVLSSIPLETTKSFSKGHVFFRFSE